MHTVHEDRLRNVICVMARNNVADAQRRSAPVQSLPPEYATECAVIALANSLNDPIHSPSIEFVVGEDLQRYSILVTVALHCLRRMRLSGRAC